MSEESPKPGDTEEKGSSVKEELCEKVVTSISEVEYTEKDAVSPGQDDEYSVEEPDEEKKEDYGSSERPEDGGDNIDVEKIEEISCEFIEIIGKPDSEVKAEETLPIVTFPSAIDLENMNVDSPTASIPPTTILAPEASKTQETPQAPETSAPSSSSRAEAGSSSTKATDVFKLKSIKFGPLTYKIVTQNANGPCPLVSIINALIIKGKLSEIEDRSVISRDQLVQVLAGHLLSAKPKNLTAEQDANWSKNLEDVINLLPQICNGLDVNVRFHNTSDFEFTPALALFDLVGLDLYHGWVVDPQQRLLADLIDALTYNQLVEKICNDQDPNIALYREFFDSSLSQLTFHGLASLAETLKDGEIAVLFRNNHFHTLMKRESELFCLVTDEGLNELPIVWESLDVGGDSVFMTGDFNIFKQAFF
ncbi:hypothetical protein WR25_21678 [Diploscapter pachys]|uniref:Ubiquitin carboxyl-terminal hydrolase n=1 Tax=Diploscapter pachys TaxID=2018661 RepID=A0A2A2LBZ4_9BILA|nr:hypothetical protein WR25_21678 [Diploscapter pachys]